MTAEEADLERLKDLLSDPWWRICNLYTIQDKSGQIVHFTPNSAQRKFWERRHTKNNILKARQLGMSTFIAIIFLDAMLFNSGISCGVIDHTLPDAKSKLAKIKFAFENLDRNGHPYQQLGSFIKQAVTLDTSAKEELGFSNGSSVWCGVSLRGGTVQMLWISELGRTAFAAPLKAEEIRTGALNTIAPDQQSFLESTHEGGKHGLNYELLKAAMTNEDDALSSMDYRFHFFPWYEDEAYSLPNPERYKLRPEMIEYFAKCEARGLKLTAGQKAWYDLKEREQGFGMLKEFPTFPEEAFSAPIEGAIYGDLVAQSRAEGRVCRVTPEPNKEIFSFWDIGMSDEGVIWLLQPTAREILVLKHYRTSGQPASHYADQIRRWENELGRPIARHYLPHDADSRERGTGKTYRQTLAECGLSNCQTVPRTPDIWLGINHLRNLFGKLWFDHELDKPLLDGKKELPSALGCLEAYRVGESKDGQVIKDKPLHDWTSHACDALRTFAEAEKAGMLEKERFMKENIRVINPLR